MAKVTNAEIGAGSIGMIRSVNGTSMSLNSAGGGAMQKPVEGGKDNPGGTKPMKAAHCEQSVPLPFPGRR